MGQTTEENERNEREPQNHRPQRYGRNSESLDMVFGLAFRVDSSTIIVRGNNKAPAKIPNLNPEVSNTLVSRFTILSIGADREHSALSSKTADVPVYHCHLLS